MDLQIPPEEMRKLISGAIMQALTPERREAMLTEALRTLLTPKSDGFGSRLPPMQEAFNNAAYSVAVEVFREELRKPAVRAQLEAMVAKALTGALAESDDITSAFTQALLNSFRRASER